MLYIIATPIGNLKDITLRSLETLKKVDAIICEDTRRTSLLLNHYQIKKPLLVLNDFNEYQFFASNWENSYSDKSFNPRNKNIYPIIERLKNGESLCLVSDAGTPLISDPGFKLVRECIAQGIEVDSLPGPSSIIVALTLSGLPTDKFSFVGYPPDKVGHRKNFYQKIKQSSSALKNTTIMFIAPFKLNKTLAEIRDELGDINLCLAKELSKIHQEVKTKKISEWLEYFKKKPPKGEWIALFNLNEDENGDSQVNANTH